MKYIIAIDQSTSGTKLGLYDKDMKLVRSLKKPHKQYYPKPGYCEHDAQEIWENTAQMLCQIAQDLPLSQIAGLGIANQRETIVLWDRQTGMPLCPAVVWQDVRAKELVAPLQAQSDRIFKLSGLRPSAYYSAAKAASLLRSQPNLQRAAVEGRLCFGTVDSYLLYRLSGGKSFATDLTNACRTQLLDIETLSWSEELAGLFQLPLSMLPESIQPCDGQFGCVESIEQLKGLPVMSMMGDSHASLFGHGCNQAGMVKTSYGTGSSIMMNIGSNPKWSKSGLSTSIGFACGGQLCYVLEGNITCSADTLIWVKDNLKLISDMSQLDEAAQVDSTDGVYLVPAFSGLGPPWLNEGARAVLYGMNRGTERAHILRAALASIAHQNADVLDAMRQDTGIDISQLRADGGGSVNPLLMQMQSDYVPCQVAVSAEKELTLKGVASMAGIAAGLFSQAHCKSDSSRLYTPQMSAQERRTEREGWADAVRRCQ